MSDQKQDMKQYSNLDSCTRVCPCGSSTSWSDWSSSQDIWMTKHKPHCSGFLVNICTDDGARAYAKKPAPERGPL